MDKQSISNTTQNLDTYTSYRKNIEDFESKIKSTEIFSKEELSIIENSPNNSAFETLSGLNQHSFSKLLPKPEFLNISESDSPISSSAHLERMISALSDAHSKTKQDIFAFSKTRYRDLVNHLRNLYQKAQEVTLIKSKIISS